MGINITPFPARSTVEVEDKERKRTLFGKFDGPFLEWFKNAYIILFDAQNSGTTAQRPAENLYVGKQYFDTTLGYAIWYDGTNWVNSAGSTV